MGLSTPYEVGYLVDIKDGCVHFFLSFFLLNILSWAEHHRFDRFS